MASASPPVSNPASESASESTGLAELFRQQQQQNLRQFQLLAEKIATAKRPRDRSPKRTEKNRIGDWHRIFNSRCIQTLDRLLEAESAEEVREGMEELQQRLKQRNFDLEMNDTHPGYLMFKDEQAKLEGLKEEGIDDSYLVAFKKNRAVSGLARPLKDRRQPFQQRGTSGSRGVGAAQRLPLGSLPWYGPASAACGAVGASPASASSSSATSALLRNSADSSPAPRQLFRASSPAITVSRSATTSVSARTFSSSPAPVRPLPRRLASDPQERFAAVFEATKGTVEFHKSVKGSMRRALSFWEGLVPDSWIVSVIAEGYRLPFVQNVQVPYLYLQNSRSTELYRAFVEAEIVSLVGSGAAREVACQPHVVSPLMVATNSSKPRLILDLSVFNTYLEYTQVKYEALDSVRDLLPSQGYMGTFDMKSGYHHIDVHEEDCKYLGFSWNFGYGVRFFVYTVLPFGLSPAPMLFTKVFRPLVHLWRSRGYSCALYLDDGIFFAPCYDQARRMSEDIQADLQAAGVITSFEKCRWSPVQRLDWLGITIDLRQFQIEVSTKRITSALNLIDSLLRTNCPSARDRMRITGKLISMAPVLGRIVQLKTRRLYESINDVFPNISRRFMFTCTEHDELMFWKRSLHVLNVCSLHQSAGAERIIVAGGSSATAVGVAPVQGLSMVSGLSEPAEAVNCREAATELAPNCLIAADASATAAGAIYYDCEGRRHVASTSFDAVEAAQSSTYRELKTILFALQSFSPLLRDRRIVVQTDNKGAVSIINKGSGRPVLQTIAEQIYDFGVKRACLITPVWVPREQNAEADEASRIVDYDDWGVKSSFFRICEKRWGPYLIDRFADHRNTKVSRFNSKFYVPGSEAVDALACHWGGEMNWLCPPISLVVQTIQHLRDCKAKGTIVVPDWPSQLYFSLLKTNGEWSPFVKDVLWVPSGTKLFNSAAQASSVFNDTYSRSPFLFLLLDFTPRAALVV
uniref:Reverse transcriptase domain-containing protein n=1 Tax=Plectus sambesii TaxID=2011161 RepID=A0A914XGM4_9BILA